MSSFQLHVHFCLTTDTNSSLTCARPYTHCEHKRQSTPRQRHSAIRYGGKLNHFVLWTWTRCKINYSLPCASLAGTINYFPSLAAAAWHVNLSLYIWPIRIRTASEAWQWWLQATSERGNPLRGRSYRHNLNLWPRHGASGDTFGTPPIPYARFTHSRSHVRYLSWFDDFNTSKIFINCVDIINKSVHSQKTKSFSFCTHRTVLI